jgi:integrase
MDEVPEFLAALSQYKGEQQTKMGVQLLMLTGVEAREIRLATPEQFGLDKGLWNIAP